MEWQPIETAPKDGTNILVSGGNCGYWCPAVLSAIFEDDEWHPDQWESPDNTLEPTHWMPLPEPPK